MATAMRSETAVAEQRKVRSRYCRVRFLILWLWVASWPAVADVTRGIEAFNSKRFVEARRELAGPAAAGDARAMAYMGEILMRGLGGSRNELEARDYIIRAHEAGDVHAGYLLGTLYLTGNLVTRDEARGVELIRRAADAGEAAAQTLTGIWLASGRRGFAKDEAKALNWFKLAAEQNHAPAMFWLGNFNERGRAGITADYVVALDWYKKGGTLGYAAAQAAAGRIYALGRGVAADGREALRWLRRAAAVNHHEAFVWIASVYEFGRGGINKDPVLAYAWYGAVPGNAPAALVKVAAAGKERLTKVLSASELQEGETQAKKVAAANTLNFIKARISGGSASGTPRKGVYGSGVVVSENGDILTNHHVINNCARVRVQPAGADVQVVASDARNDLALLRGESLSLPPVRLRAGRNVRLGDDIIAIGYPLKGVLSSGAVVTSGIVNALTGLRDDTSAFQISATVQPGSSGGPIFDRSGNLVGIVRARLLPTGPANPQNVNFGINLATVSGFLDSHSVNYLTALSTTVTEIADLVEQARKSTLQIECY